MLEFLKTLLAEFKTTYAETSARFERAHVFPEVPNKMKVALGMWRVGKTFFLMQTIRNLVGHGKIP